MLKSHERSQAWLARKADLSENYLSERLRLVKSFTLTDIEKIADALGIDPVQFLLDMDREPIPGGISPADAAAHRRNVTGHREDYAKAAFEATEDDRADEPPTV